MKTIKKIVFYSMVIVTFLLTVTCEKKDLSVPVESVELDTMSLVLIKGFSGHDTYTLKAKIIPENATNQKLIWTSSDRDVVTVNDGVITVVDPGEAKIYVTSDDGGSRTTCLVVVMDKPVLVTGVKFKKDEYTFEKGTGFALMSEIVWGDEDNAEEPTDNYLKWTSDDYETATVTPRGYLDALEVGTVTIRATARCSYCDRAEQFLYEAECIVHVIPGPVYVSEVTLDKATIPLEFGSSAPPDKLTATLTATLIPANPDDTTVEWESSDPTVVSVDATGLTATITALKIGNAEITVISKGGKDGAEIKNTATVNVTRYIPPYVMFVPAGADLATTIEENPDKSEFWLEGAEYALDGITFSRSVSLVGELSERTKINLTKTVSFASAAAVPVIDAIEFVNIEFRGVNNADYMYNINSAFSDIGKISYKDCKLADFGRNFFRTQGSASSTIGEFIIDNCEIEKVGISNGGDYAFLHMDVDAMAVDNIVIKNSTFNVVGCHFIYFARDRAVTQKGCKSITIENCTFNNMMYSGSGRWFINTCANGTNPEQTEVTLKNLILGSTVMTGTATHNGLNNPNGTTTVVNVYQTADWAVNNAIPDVTPYSGSVTDLFVNPTALQGSGVNATLESGDFSIKDAAFPGKGTAGDPRWW